MVGLGLGMSAWAMVAAPSWAECTFFAEPQRYNTERQGDVLVIGQQRDRPYRVVIIGADSAVLSAVRACVLDAFATRTDFGPYIQVASFANRGDAEIIRRILQRAGHHPRVIYTP
ncbi:MAG: hypothetical protein HC800_07150 [Phormidesmis sp. RL_2_1]|nr:hypothetical protein [Phormidesmis sp. RL_2_1]